jgi:hypothetical protein
MSFLIPLKNRNLLAAEERAAPRPPIRASSLKLAILDGSFIGNRYAAG